jgi:membrane protease YdiL (CAAX protease family)
MRNIFLRTNALLCDFLDFVKQPLEPNYPDVSTIQKLINVCVYILCIDFIINMLLWYGVVEAVEKTGWFFHPLIEKRKGITTLSIVSAVVLAPVIEELIFRLFLVNYKTEFYFRWVYYFSAIIFGLIHIITYEADSTHYRFMWLITLPQIFSGFLLGYVRIIYGFWYAVLLHGLANALALIWEYFVGF